ncbi:hypothetical protein M409DRAFT_48605 [Zasmidium cellare ATCC 36951]|uniref:Uncharacterized protein n=1 Tax=Zasmidium cellare ATCC 36951 TaxID=1080233 RepID=A0A6A6D2Q2_ZASCE|nr:uncharacterized protein M409DRAFT_48605 [Zasmidium cellare ATCC 36951]KAF2173661.1 hypothetical protein M409DRAFT_48605 [Zasmidium cellare ATCC 36951]
MQPSPSIDSNAPVDVRQSTEMPEHVCSTFYEALNIVKDQCTTSMERFVTKWASVLSSNTRKVDKDQCASPMKRSLAKLASVLSSNPRIVDKDQKAIVEDIQKAFDQINSAEFLHYETGNDVVYAGHKFSFHTIETAMHFKVKSEE